MRRPLISAHRGGPEGMYAPNSLEAIAAALDVGVDLVEFDVRTTKDGQFLTYHDDGVVIENQRCLIQDLTEEEVLTHAPEAARVVEILALLKGRAIGHVDLKDTRLELEIADLCEEMLGMDGFVLTTLEDVSVALLRRNRPHLRVALSLGRDAAGLTRRQVIELRLSEIFPGRRVRACGANVLALNHRIARLGAMRWAQRHGVDVLLWTLNDPGLLRKVVHDDRYWAFTTDFPRLAMSLSGETE